MSQSISSCEQEVHLLPRDQPVDGKITTQMAGKMTTQLPTTAYNFFFLAYYCIMAGKTLA